MSLNLGLASATRSTAGFRVFKPEPDAKLVLSEGTTKKYVKADANKAFRTQPAGSLVSKPPHNKDGTKEFTEILAFGDEEDISRRVNSASPIYTLPLGVTYDDDAVGAAFNFCDAVIEYRSNAGVPSSRPSTIAGKIPTYGVTYISVGIPEARIHWLKNDIEEVTKVPLSLSGNGGPTFNNEYAWFNANITANIVPEAFITRNGTTQSVSVLSLLRMHKSNLIGTVSTSISLKRVWDGDVFSRALSISFKAIQVVSETKISSPPLSGTIEFVPDTTIQVSDSIWDLLQSEKRKANIAAGVATNPATKKILPSATTSM